MCRITWFRIFIASWVLTSGLVLAATLSVEQLEVQALIRSLYAIATMTFEGETIEKMYNPRKVKQEIYPKYFSMEKIAHIKSIVNEVGFIRHPALDGDDIGGFGSQVPSKNPKVLPPVVNGDNAYVDVYPDTNGRTIYFLSKTPNGWRIINTASYSAWPTRDDGTCWEPFYLIKPTADQLALETKECIKYRKSH